MVCEYHLCKTELTGKQLRFCRPQCKSKFYVIKNRRDSKARAVKYKGGCCERCGYNKSLRALSFHHNDPDTKDFGISFGGHNRGWNRVLKELDKCSLLCANCHMEIEEEKCAVRHR